jgi:hypothetical protein
MTWRNKNNLWFDLPGQTGKVQFSQRGLSPMRTFATEDLPTPVDKIKSKFQDILFKLFLQWRS